MTLRILGLFFFAFVACGESGTVTEEFAGRWTFDEGSVVTVSCPSQDDVVNSIANTGLEIEELEGNGLRITNSVPCVFEYAVSGNTARLEPTPQVCDVPDGQGGTTVETRMTETVVFSDNMLSLETSGTLAIAGCTISVTGSLSR